MNIVKFLLDQYKIIPNRESGQNFIQNEKIANRFIESAQIQPKDVVLEIGPGLGILTQKLCEKADTVIAVEKDLSLYKLLQESLKNYNNLILLNENVLKLKLAHLSSVLFRAQKSVLFRAPKFKIVSNIPYSITSDFLYWLLENRKYISSSTLILQKEVVERLIAGTETKLYGSLSVFFQTYTDLKILFSIPGSAFYPHTKVTSTVLYISPRRIKIKNEELFFKIVKLSFAQRRKQLKNSLSSILSGVGTRHGVSIDLSRRPETLSYKEFIKLASGVQKL